MGYRMSTQEAQELWEARSVVSNEWSLEDHAFAMARLLRSEWQAEGNARSWHARYWIGGTWYNAALVQQRGLNGYRVSVITRGTFQTLSNGVDVSLMAACVWLG